MIKRILGIITFALAIVLLLVAVAVPMDGMSESVVRDSGQSIILMSVGSLGIEVDQAIDSVLAMATDPLTTIIFFVIAIALFSRRKKDPGTFGRNRIFEDDMNHKLSNSDPGAFVNCYRVIDDPGWQLQ